MRGIIWILIFVWPALLAMKRDFQKGLAVVLTLFGFMPNSLVAGGMGGGFELTFQRVLLVIVTLFWIPWASNHRPLKTVPFLSGLMLLWGSNLFSLVFALDFGHSLKSFISFSTEIALFYFIVATAVTNQEYALRAYRALCVSTAIIAVLGFIEYYWNFNPAIEWLGVDQPKGEVDTLVTFKHRILFGYSMAMGWPLLLAESQYVEGRKKTWSLIGLAVLALASCYFSGSRGPWFGAAIAGIVMVALGGRGIRKCMLTFLALSILVTIVRPGVRDTLVDLVGSTFDKDSYRGMSFYYREELWPVARSLAAVSVVRMAVGYGGLAVEVMDLSDRFQYGGSTKLIGFSSWDNNYAADLVEFGYGGLIIEWVFLTYILVKLGRATLRAPQAYRDRMAAIVSALVVYAFALTNVYMFSPQLKCVFWTLVLVGSRFTEPAAEWMQATLKHSAGMANGQAEAYEGTLPA